MIVGALCCLLILPAFDDAPAVLRQLRAEAQEMQRLSGAAAARWNFVREDGGDFITASSVELDTDGAHSRLRTIHFGPETRGVREAERTDRRLNTVFQLGARQVLIHEFRRVVKIRSFDAARMDLRLFEPGYFERLFLRPVGLESAPQVPTFEEDEQGERKWINAKDYWLVEALQRDWRVVEPAQPIPGGAASDSTTEKVHYLRRDWENDSSDELWVRPGARAVLLARALRVGGRPIVTARFHDFHHFETNLPWPRSIDWRTSGGDQLLMLERLEFGARSEERFSPVFPPSTIVEDEISGKREYTPGEVFSAAFTFLKQIQRERGFRLSPYAYQGIGAALSWGGSPTALAAVMAAIGYWMAGIGGFRRERRVVDESVYDGASA